MLTVKYLNPTVAMMKYVTKLSVRNVCSLTIKRLAGTVLACAVASGACAQSNDAAAIVAEPLRPVLSAYTVEVGRSHIADTYLTPVKYDGWHMALHYERMQAMKFNPQQWVMQLDFQINGDHTQNFARNATMWYLDANARWSMMRRWRNIGALPKLTLGVGPGTELNVGALYLTRNGNNPVAAKAAWTVNASAYVAYDLRLGRLPVTLRYQASLPVTGAFFSPDYGELYYEIWLGNHSGLAHAAWWGNYFKLDNYLTADLRFKGTNLRIGYHNDILSTKVSGIVSERITHAVSIGITTEWLSLSSHRKSGPNTQTFSPLY
jgi:hypothetical protein